VEQKYRGHLVEHYLENPSSPAAIALVAKSQAVALWFLNDPHAWLLLDLIYRE